MPRVHPPVARGILAAVVVLALTACTSSSGDDDTASPEQPGATNTPVAAPELGQCRVLEPGDVAQPSNDSPVVDCAEEHTAETFVVGSFPASVAGDDAAYDDPALGRFMYDECRDRFEKFVAGDESSVLRSLVSWVWFRAPEADWADGARWYRCDIVGGTDTAAEYRPLPQTAEGLLTAPPDDAWMACIDGPQVPGAPRVPCSEPHTWRAATTIKLGEPNDRFPGDRVVEVRTRDFCADSVLAWLNYPPEYEFGYTWYHRAEWKAGNRRSICWARTDQ